MITPTDDIMEDPDEITAGRPLCQGCGGYEDQCHCPLYVNVYLETQERGGPEEGGWYYRAGEPIESHRVDTQEQADALRRELTERYADDNLRLYKSFWTKYDHYVVVHERQFATAYPAARPHYE